VGLSLRNPYLFDNFYTKFHINSNDGTEKQTVGGTDEVSK